MTTRQQRLTGCILLILGGVFYLQAALFQGFLFAHRNDFAHLYIAGYLANHGGNFFDPAQALRVHRALEIPTGLNPFVYPPFFAILLIPLSWLTYDAAWSIFTLLSHCAFFISLTLLVRMFRQEFEEPLLWWGGLVFFSAIFTPLINTYTAGQVNTFLLLIICLAWYAIRQGQGICAGVVLGLGASVKVTPAFLLLYFAWKREWRVFLSGILILLLTFLISWLVLGAEVHTSFLSEVPQMSYGSSTWAQFNQHYHDEPHNQAPAALWYRLLTLNHSTLGIKNSPLLARLLSYLTAFILLSLLIWKTPIKPPPSAWEYSLWLIVMLMLPSLMWEHYLVQVFFAIAVALRLFLDRARLEDLSGYKASLLALALGLMAVPYLYNFEPFRQGWLTLAMSVKLYGLLCLVVFLLWNRPQDDPESQPVPGQNQ